MYQPDESIRLEVWLENETVWLTQAELLVANEKTRSV